MKQIHAIVVGAIIALTPQTVGAVPVVPNFTQGSMTSNTTTTSTVTETINSMDYNTGYQYVVTGTNIEHSGNSISPPGVNTTTNTNKNPTNNIPKKQSSPWFHGTFRSVSDGSWEIFLPQQHNWPFSKRKIGQNHQASG